MDSVKSVVVATLLAVASTAGAETTTAPEGARKPTAIERLQAALKCGDTESRKAAVKHCGSEPVAATALGLAPLLVNESEDLRVAAAVALGRMEGLAEAAKVLHAAVPQNLKNPRVLNAIFEAIARVGHESSVSFCRRFAGEAASSKDPALSTPAYGATSALAAFRSRDAVDALRDLRLIASRAGGDATIRESIGKSAVDAIKALVPDAAGLGAEEFATWWKRHRHEYRGDMTKQPQATRKKSR